MGTLRIVGGGSILLAFTEVCNDLQGTLPLLTGGPTLSVERDDGQERDLTVKNPFGKVQEEETVPTQFTGRRKGIVHYDYQ